MVSAGPIGQDGTVPSRYGLTENESTDYTVRTRQNVVDSDATLILYEQRLRGGAADPPDRQGTRQTPVVYGDR